MTKTKRKRVTYEKYNKRMGEIGARYNTVHESLMAMMEYAATVELIPDKHQARNRKRNY